MRNPKKGNVAQGLLAPRAVRSETRIWSAAETPSAVSRLLGSIGWRSRFPASNHSTGETVCRSSAAPCLYAVVFALSIGMWGCRGQSDTDSVTNGAAELTHVTLQLNWFPEVEHGGFYAALLHGFYEDEGLDVEIKPGGPNLPVIQQVDAGRVDFAVSGADRVIFGRDAGADVVALMAAMQHSPRCILVHEESGIRSLKELRDVTLAVGSGPAFYKYMAKKLPLENVQTVAYPGSIGPFLANPRFSQQAYVFSEPYLAAQKGAHPVTLMVSELGYDPYSSVLVTRGEMIQKNTDVVGQFVRASLHGWRTYLADPVRTNRFLDEINPDMEPGVLAYGVEKMAPLCLPEAMSVEEFGTMSEQRWQTLVNQLAEIELVDASQLVAAELFTTQFLERADE